MRLQHWVLSLTLSFVFAKGCTAVTTERLVTKAGYPYEEHLCKTSDGYILTLHRIPYSPRMNTTSTRPVAFLMHGFLGSSNDWVILGPSNALAYTLSDTGYDVWMGNARGNRYSRKHVTHSPETSSFWNFSYHEIGLIDTPDMIDYTRSFVGVDQVRYFGHSQGTTTFLVLTSLNPDFKSRIKSAHLLAPVAYIDHLESPFKWIVAPLFGQPQPFVEIFGCSEFLPNNKITEKITEILCKTGSPLQFLCLKIAFNLYGFDLEGLNATKIPEFFSIIPAGASVNQLMHFSQGYYSRAFRQFDYGKIRNYLTYGSYAPPSYPLEEIDVPIFLYYGKNDYICALKDVERLINRLSNTTLRGAYLVPHPKWNHADFVWGKNVKEQLYDVIMKDVASIE